MVGGCVDPVAGSADPDCGVYDDGPTTAVMRFRTVIQDEFTDSYLPATPATRASTKGTCSMTE